MSIVLTISHPFSNIPVQHSTASYGFHTALPTTYHHINQHHVTTYPPRSPPEFHSRRFERQHKIQRQQQVVPRALRSTCWSLGQTQQRRRESKHEQQRERLREMHPSVVLRQERHGQCTFSQIPASQREGEFSLPLNDLLNELIETGYVHVQRSPARRPRAHSGAFHGACGSGRWRDLG